MKKAAVALTMVIIVTGGTVMEERSGLLRAGDRAPEFSATLSNGVQMSLTDYRGQQNVVLFFYPKDHSRGCTQEVCLYRDNYEEVRRLNAVMIGVSYDSPSSHDAFVSGYQLPFPLISDADRSLSKLYGTARFGGRVPVAKRVTYVIDRDGIVRGVFHHEFLIEKHIDDVLETLRSLQ